VSCSEKKDSVPKRDPAPGASKDPNSSNSAPAGTNDFCKPLRANSGLKDLFSEAIDEMCDAKNLPKLRGEWLYLGEATTKEQITNQNTDEKHAEMRLLGATLNDCTGAEYYKMLQTQISDPEEFKSKGFEYDEKITYTVDKDRSTKAKTAFTYDYTTDGAVKTHIKWGGLSTFYTIRERSGTTGAIYAVGTMFDKSVKESETLTNIDSLIVVNEYQASVGGSKQWVAEVLVDSFQAYDPTIGNKQSILSDAKAKFGSEQARAFRNGRKAKAGN